MNNLPDSIMLFIPAYQCEKQIGRVINSLSQKGICNFFAEIVVIENRSQDNTLEIASKALSSLLDSVECRVTLLQNNKNFNLGGSHKVAFNYCLKQGYNYIAVLHGDDQGDVNDLKVQLENVDIKKFDCLLGARFMESSRLLGYSKFRIIGNKLLNFIITIATRKKIYDMGAGLNLYKAEFLKDQFYLSFPNDLTFNVYLLLYTVWRRATFQFFPLTWKEDDQVSNAKIFRQAIHILILVFLYTINPRRVFAQKHNETDPMLCEYKSTKIPLRK